MQSIPFEVQIKEKTPNIEQSLRDEAPGIFNWMVEGLRKYYEFYKENGNGLRAPKIVTDSTNDYRKEMDTISMFFDNRCIVDKKAKNLKSTLLYEEYVRYCEERIGFKTADGQSIFIKEMRKKKVIYGFDEGTTDGSLAWKHLRTKTDEESNSPENKPPVPEQETFSAAT
jgi:putative DNA primase/helicase